jgi:hypothetical protein
MKKLKYERCLKERIKKVEDQNAAFKDALSAFLNNSSIQANQPSECEKAEALINNQKKAEFDSQGFIADDYLSLDTEVFESLLTPQPRKYDYER